MSHGEPKFRGFCTCPTAPCPACQDHDDARREALRMLTQQAIGLLERAERAEAVLRDVQAEMDAAAMVLPSELEAMLRRHSTDPTELRDDGEEG